MKKLIGSDIGSYVFDPLDKAIALIDLPPVALSNLLVITNVTRGAMIYNFADPSIGGSIASNLITLEFDTTLHDPADILQIWIDLPDKSQGQTLRQVNIDGTSLLIDDETGAIFTRDQKVAEILGGVLVADAGRLRTKEIFEDFIVKGRLGVAQEAIGIDCRGCPSVTVELTGTWSATVTFEGRADDGTFVALSGISVSGNVLSTSAISSGIYRINTTGIQRFQLRLSSYSSGTVLVSMVASGEPGVVSLTSPVTGSLFQAISQKATTYETNTYDTNLAVTFGSAALYRIGFTGIEQVVAPTINPTQPTVYAGPMYSRYPQIFPRMRVESAGDQRLPFAQEPISNRMMVATPELYSMLEQILIQIKVLNNMYIQVNQCVPPPFWEELK